MAQTLDPAMLQAVFLWDPKAATQLVDHADTGAVDTHEGPNGPVVGVFGRKLHSLRDPAKEARRFVRKSDISRASIVVLMGYGSGYVAREILRRTTALILVFEPSLEVLKRGLQHGATSSRIQIVTTPTALAEALYRCLSSGDQGRVLKWLPSVRTATEIYEAAMYQTGRAIERARLRDLTTQFRVDGWLDFYLANLPQLSRTPGLAQLRGVLKGIPAIVCAAGPSLAKNVTLLRDIRDEVFIICVNTAARALAKAGVLPHAVISVESLDVSLQFEGVDWMPEVVAFLELTGNPALFNLPFARHLPISVDTSSCSQFTRKIDEGHGFSAGFCVANAAASLVQQLGSTQIILCGQDLAYEGEKVYAEGTVFENIRVNLAGTTATHQGVESKKAIEAASSGTLRPGVSAANNFRSDRVRAWGKPTETVMTNRDFMHFRDWFMRAAPILHEHGVETINATEGGAHISGWDEIRLEDLIEREGWRHARRELSVGDHFSAWLDAASPTPAKAILHAIRDERSCILDLVRMGLETRALVDDDPDGDIMADSHITDRLVRLTTAISEKIHAYPIVRESLTVPISSLMERQELNTMSLQATIEQHVQVLDERLAAVEAQIEAQIEAQSESVGEREDAA